MNLIVALLLFCSPNAYNFVQSQNPVILVTPLSTSYALPPFILLSAGEPHPELTLVHESYHLWQHRQPEWQSDLTLYGVDPFAKFRVELAANDNPYMDEVRNCQDQHSISTTTPAWELAKYNVPDGN